MNAEKLRDAWGIVRLEGYINKQDQLVKLAQSMMKIKGITNVENKVRTTPWPLCETYLYLETYRSHQSKDLTASIVGHPDNSLNVSDTFELDVKLPKSPGFLYTVYLQSSGGALRFYWGKQYSHEQNITLGGPGYKISSPLGKEMILLITSPKPFFSSENINPTKPDKKFLTELKAASRESTPKDRSTICYTTLEVSTMK